MPDDVRRFDGRCLEQFQRDGFVILRRLFPLSEMVLLRNESERLLRDCADLIHPRNLRCRYMPHHETNEPLFEVFDPVNDLSPICRQFCIDWRILEVVEAIYGEPCCQFKDKLRGCASSIPEIAGLVYEGSDQKGGSGAWMRLWFESVGVRVAKTVKTPAWLRSIGGSICC